MAKIRMHIICVLQQHRLVGLGCSHFFRTIHSSSLFHATKPSHAHFKLRRSKAKRKLYHEHNSVAHKSDEFSSAIRRTSIIQGDEHDHEQLFGIHPIFSALENNRRKFESLYIRSSTYKKLTDTTISYSEDSVVHSGILKSIWAKVNERDIPVVPVNKSKLDKLANYGIHQGLVLTASPLELDWVNDHMLRNHTRQNSLWVLINNVVDPMNLGGLIRTAVYFGVEKIFISNNCSKLSPVVSKASSGAMEYAKMHHVGNTTRLLSTLVELGWDVIGTTCSERENSVPADKLSRNKNMLVILGNEGRGLDEGIFHQCTCKVTIPSDKDCPPFIDSLNVSVAAGVILNGLSATTT